jgi:hypothetical protein
MDFDYTITFETGRYTIVRHGRGLFFPHEGDFNHEHNKQLWLMTEKFGRPEHIDVDIRFSRLLDT